MMPVRPRLKSFRRRSPCPEFDDYRPDRHGSPRRRSLWHSRGLLSRKQACFWSPTHPNPEISVGTPAKPARHEAGENLYPHRVLERRPTPLGSSLRGGSDDEATPDPDLFCFAPPTAVRMSTMVAASNTSSTKKARKMNSRDFPNSHVHWSSCVPVRASSGGTRISRHDRSGGGGACATNSASSSARAVLRRFLPIFFHHSEIHGTRWGPFRFVT